ncbi:MAG: O-antigen ligase family protein [Thermogutta sp.]
MSLSSSGMANGSNSGSWGGVLFSGQGILLTITVTTLFAGIIFGYPFWHTRSLGIPITCDRILLGCLILGTTLFIAKNGISFSKVTRGDLFLAVFLVYIAISASMTLLSEGELKPLSRWLFFYLVPGILYFSVRQTAISHFGERAILWAIGCLGVYLSLIGVAEVLNLRFLVVPPYIVDGSAGSEFLGRARGPLLNPVVNGFLMTTAWAAWVLLGRSLSRQWWPALTIVHWIMAAGIISTLTRSVWLGTFLGGLLLGYQFVPKRYRPAWLATGVLGLALMALVVKGFFWEMKRDRDLSAAEAARSAQLRPVLAQVAWEMTKDHPLFGVGLAEYDRAKGKYLADPQASLPINQAKAYTQHNVFLSILVETGIVGLMAFLFLLAAWARDANLVTAASSRDLTILASVALAAYVVNGLFHDVSIIPQMNAVLFTVVGLAESADAHRRVSRGRGSPRSYVRGSSAASVSWR